MIGGCCETSLGQTNIRARTGCYARAVEQLTLHSPLGRIQATQEAEEEKASKASEPVCCSKPGGSDPRDPGVLI